MGLLNHFFAGNIAKTAEKANNDLQRIWADFLKAHSEKQVLVADLSVENVAAHLPRLWKLLSLELADIEEETKSEQVLLGELGAVEHEKELRSLHNLERALRYVETRHQYFDALLGRLHDCLKLQLHIAEKLSLDARQPAALVSAWRAQSAIEDEIVKRIEDCRTFQDGFVDLMKGVYVVERLGKREAKLAGMLKKRLGKVFSGEVQGGVYFAWASKVMRDLEEAIFEAIGNELDGHHETVDYEFVNRPMFVELVRRSVPARAGKISERDIQAFVAVFREWYNER